MWVYKKNFLLRIFKNCVFLIQLKHYQFILKQKKLRKIFTEKHNLVKK
jgi:hypothetical protein